MDVRLIQPRTIIVKRTRKNLAAEYTITEKGTWCPFSGITFEGQD